VFRCINNFARGRHYITVLTYRWDRKKVGNKEMRTILVLGGGGFIGSHLVRRSFERALVSLSIAMAAKIITM
jgi:hypothetical protein